MRGERPPPDRRSTPPLVPRPGSRSGSQTLSGKLRKRPAEPQSASSSAAPPRALSGASQCSDRHEFAAPAGSTAAMLPDPRYDRRPDVGATPYSFDTAANCRVRQAPGRVPGRTGEWPVPTRDTESPARRSGSEIQDLRPFPVCFLQKPGSAVWESLHPGRPDGQSSKDPRGVKKVLVSGPAPPIPAASEEPRGRAGRLRWIVRAKGFPSPTA